MLKKSECEIAIRHLCREWSKHKGFTPSPEIHASFYEFKDWLASKGYAHYLNFRSTLSSDCDAEAWFDEEMKQTWRR